jgi:dephospho-CoA kinase
MRVIGLTGGIAMGKSTIARLLRLRGIPVFDADAEVRRLQAPGGAALSPIAAAFPGAVVGGVLDRAALRRLVLGDPAALNRLERIVHPMVRARMRRFIQRHRRAGARAVTLDIPLLFEGGAPVRLDHVLTVSAPADIQRARLRRRGIMSGPQIAAVLARQLPDATRRRRADTVLRTGLSRRHAQASLSRVLARLLPEGRTR